MKKSILSPFSRWFYFICLYLGYYHMQLGYYTKSSLVPSINTAVYAVAVGLMTFLVTIVLMFFVFRSSTRGVNNSIVILLNIISIILLYKLLNGMTGAGYWVEHSSNSTGVLYRSYYIQPYVGAIGVYISVVYYCSKYLLKLNNISQYRCAFKQEYKHTFKLEYKHRLLPYIPLMAYLPILFFHDYLPKPYFNG